MKFLAASFSLLICTIAAEATTVQFAGHTSDPTIFKYNLQLHNERIYSGDFFTIYNFAGFENALAPANWTAAASAEVDGDAYRDVTFTYNGAAPISVAPTAPPLTLTFEIDSLYNSVTTGSYLAQVTQYNNTSKKKTDEGFIEVADVSVPVDPSPNPVPEPGSMALLGAGLTAFGFIRRRRSI